ncbi:MAG: hypothetical protein II961_00855 [Candidatus Riflebacteria bacterium]|nr:hypothetical protein [Candidatus Riflebacteria bacterium]
MLKKLITVALILFIANQAYSQELTPLQKRVRTIFSEIRNRNQVERVKEEKAVEETPSVQEEETSNYYIETVVEEENPTEIVLASDQDDVEEYEEGDGEEEIVVATAPKADCESKVVDDSKEYSDVITAADASSKDRTAVINKKWSIEALGWNTELDGHVKIVENKNLPNSGEIIDFGRDTRNLDKKKVPGLKLSYRVGGRASVDFNWTKIEQNGSLAIARQFKGVNYAANANFEINNSMYDLVWKYRFSHKVEETGREKSYVAGLLGIKASDMEFKLSGDVAGVPQSTSYSETFPVPYIGVEAGTYLGENLYLKGYYRFLKLDGIKDYDAKHADFDISLSYKLSNKDCDQDLFVDVGYRQVSYDVDGKGNDVELKYKGPYVGLEFRF